ncbi:hypothetical protein VTL71DRAFT_6831 [Oculimacula yallundae]|uniref:Uncharacterized protein n=1 Tax=Oculimacula yallundae TaxID=86028 RepID=A0ABR4BY30_9HELO
MSIPVKAILNETFKAIILLVVETPKSAPSVIDFIKEDLFVKPKPVSIESMAIPRATTKSKKSRAVKKAKNNP